MFAVRNRLSEYFSLQLLLLVLLVTINRHVNTATVTHLACGRGAPSTDLRYRAFQFRQKKFRFDSILAIESIFFDSIRFGNLINLPLVHWYSNSNNNDRLTAFDPGQPG